MKTKSFLLAASIVLAMAFWSCSDDPAPSPSGALTIMNPPLGQVVVQVYNYNLPVTNDIQYAGFLQVMATALLAGTPTYVSPPQITLDGFGQTGYYLVLVMFGSETRLYSNVPFTNGIGFIDWNGSYYVPGSTVIPFLSSSSNGSVTPGVSSSSEGSVIPGNSSSSEGGIIPGNSSSESVTQPSSSSQTVVSDPDLIWERGATMGMATIGGGGWYNYANQYSWVKYCDMESDTCEPDVNDVDFWYGTIDIRLEPQSTTSGGWAGFGFSWVGGEDVVPPVSPFGDHTGICIEYKFTNIAGTNSAITNGTWVLRIGTSGAYDNDRYISFPAQSDFAVRRFPLSSFTCGTATACPALAEAKAYSTGMQIHGTISGSYDAYWSRAQLVLRNVRWCDE